MFVSSGEDSESLGYLLVKKKHLYQKQCNVFHKSTKRVLAGDFNWGKQMHLTEYGSIFNEYKLLHLL